MKYIIHEISIHGECLLCRVRPSIILNESISTYATVLMFSAEVPYVVDDVNTVVVRLQVNVSYAKLSNSMPLNDAPDVYLYALAGNRD